MESYGVAVFRYNKGLELLMVKKKCSYAFTQIAMGNYSRKKTSLARLVSRTTFLEKSILLQQNFNFIYFHAFSVNPDNLSFQEFKWFDRAKRIFHKRFPGKLLEKLIYGAKSEELIWEFPKGKLMRETTIECAKREFIEETGITEFKLIDAAPIVFDFVDENIKFRYTIYIAESENIDFSGFRKHSFAEISEIKWINANQAKFTLNTKSSTLFRIIAKKIKKIKNKNYFHTADINLF